MAQLRDFSEGKQDLYKINPAIIAVEGGWNVRDLSDPENVEHIEQLAASIREVGVKVPLRVIMKDDKVVLREGHCRMAAIQKLIKEGVEIKTVPVIGLDRKENDADHILGQIVSNSGKPLSPLETAYVLAKLMDMGWLNKDIAAKTGLKAARVSQLMELNSLPERLKGLIKQGRVSATYCLELYKKYDKDTEKVYDMIVNASEHAAQESGGAKKRAMPKHMGEGEGSGEGGEGSSEKVTFSKQTMKEFFAACEIDNSGDLVELRVDHEAFEIIRNLLKL